MKHTFFAVIAIFAASLFSLPAAYAVSTSATPAKVICSSTNVGSTWVPVVTSSLKAFKGILVASSANDSGGTLHDVQVGIAAAGATANTEVAQVIVPSTTATTAVFIPLVGSSQTRISVNSQDGATLSKGEIQVTLIFN